MNIESLINGEITSASYIQSFAQSESIENLVAYKKQMIQFIASSPFLDDKGKISRIDNILKLEKIPQATRLSVETQAAV